METQWERKTNVGQKPSKMKKNIQQKQHRVQTEMLNGGVTQTRHRNVDDPAT
jgi:hypothetical protein